jgi:hypothetical protein
MRYLHACMYGCKECKECMYGCTIYIGAYLSSALSSLGEVNGERCAGWNAAGGISIYLVYFASLYIFICICVFVHLLLKYFFALLACTIITSLFDFRWRWGNHEGDGGMNQRWASKGKQACWVSFAMNWIELNWIELYVCTWVARYAIKLNGLFI